MCKNERRQQNITKDLSEVITQSGSKMSLSNILGGKRYVGRLRLEQRIAVDPLAE